MKRSDRLFELISLLRDGKVHRGSDLAQRMGVSDRTLYRDMETLIASGLPVEGARGIGYRMTAPVTLPPLNLSMSELEALHLGLAIVAEGADDELGKAARSLSQRIDSALPEEPGARGEGWALAVHPFAEAAQAFRHMPRLRAALRARQKLSLDYRDLSGDSASHVIRPLKLDYWGRVWTLTAWCETSGDFRVFRVDRITGLRVLPALFIDEDGKTLEDYARAVARRAT
ncbi:helix-turn-helix transcriptional regulator [Anianabacter salinae]|uniref:helix-turn-helix transcriptional regulator n=1 Tax=Anianabacter salinae TaxID=2851023 RepID=UPI00225E3862|nr:YafY family protein [Anianabacter salinae]MBV0911462.1 YafY family transcriptional regulator [Anianabacter salinae]